MYMCVCQKLQLLPLKHKINENYDTNNIKNELDRFYNKKIIIKSKIFIQLVNIY